MCSLIISVCVMLHVIVGVRIRLFVVKLIFCSGVKRKEIVRSVEKKMNVLKLLQLRKAGKMNQNLVLGLEMYIV